MTVTPNELAQMQADWDDSLNDTCQIGTRTGTADTYGEMIESYSYATAVACGFEYTGGQESEREQGTILPVDARVRFARATTITHRDRVKLTKRWGTALGMAQTFEVVGYPEAHEAGVIVDLREIK